MKKLFIAIATVALVFSASCTKVNPEEKKAEKISFQVANYAPATKAISLFEDGITSFKCKAFMVGEGVTGYQPFFGDNGETIKPNVTTIPENYAEPLNTLTEWAPSHDYYWPKSDKSYIDFFSWYDTGAGPAITYSGTTFTMAWTDRIIAAGDNIMYADPAWRFQKNNTETANQANGYWKDAVTEGVPTLFHHALAQIEIRAYAQKLTNGTATWTIKLTDLALSIVNKGSLTLTATEPTSGFNTKGTWDGTPAWTATGTAADIFPDASDDFNVTETTATADAAKLLSPTVVLPQSVASVNLTFNLDITTTYDGGVSNHEIIPQTIALGTDGFGTADNAWKLNTKYLYTILIKPAEKKVLFDPAVESAWTELSYSKEL